MARFHQMNAETFGHNGLVYFQSYDTVVCVFDPENRKFTLLQHWRYSSSTTRQVMRFINEQYVWLGLTARELVRDLEGTNAMVYSCGNFSVQIVYKPSTIGKLNAQGAPLRLCI